VKTRRKESTCMISGEKTEGVKIAGEERLRLTSKKKEHD
jgi:hypothetical protein